MSRYDQLHTDNRTFLGRYWTEHSLLRRYVPSDRDTSILSFGCSTGEELGTIRALFPAARLYGCDVDWHNLQAARALVGPTATIFHSSDAEVVRHGPYTIVLCNSVLLRPTRLVDGRRTGIDIDLWRDAVSLLDEVLVPGGFLQVINSNIPFRYHPAAAAYAAVRSPLILGPNFVDQFTSDGRPLCSGVPGAGWSAILSRHLADEGWPELRPSDLHDVHFHKCGPDGPPPAIEDEIIPTLPRYECWASGTMTYRPARAPEGRLSTHTEIDVSWASIGVDAVRLDRTARRIWFDGSVALTSTTVTEMRGATATAFIEAATGRASSRLSLDALVAPHAIRSPSY